MFRHNVGAFDRAARLLVGACLLSFALAEPQTPLGHIGIVPLLTAVIGSCPLYSMLGLCTVRRRKA